MKQRITAKNYNDEDGNPAGGSVTGEGLWIKWQGGPLGRCACLGPHEECADGGMDSCPCVRDEPTGAFVETVIEAAKQRIEYYQTTKFECQENANAINYLIWALRQLGIRTALREERGVEVTHEV